MNNIFIDTGAFIAKYLPEDQFHLKALGLWQKLEKKQTKLITSNFVLDETLTLLARRADYSFSSRIAQAIYASKVIKIIRPTLETEYGALVYFEKFSDQRVSFTDCVSFQMMKEHRIKQAFSFDRHFELAGFSCI